MWMPAGWADKCVIRLASSYEIARAKASVKSVRKKTDRPLPQPARSAFHSVSSSTCGLISRVVRLDCLNSKQWNFLLFASRGPWTKMRWNLAKTVFLPMRMDKLYGPIPFYPGHLAEGRPKIPTTHETIADRHCAELLKSKSERKFEWKLCSIWYISG